MTASNIICAPRPLALQPKARTGAITRNIGPEKPEQENALLPQFDDDHLVHDDATGVHSGGKTRGPGMARSVSGAPLHRQGRFAFPPKMAYGHL